MEKLENIIKRKENEPAPPATLCKRCGQEAKPKFVTIIGWRQQEYCEPCAEIVRKEQELKEREQQKAEKISKFLENSGVTRGKFCRMNFDSFEKRHQGKAFETAKKYAEEFSPATKSGLFFYSKAGAGKTHLAVSIARHLIEQKQIAASFIRVVDLFLNIRQTYNADESYRTESEMGLLRKYTTTPLLILDDLGAEKTSEWVRQILYQIIDSRWIDEKPFIITSNLTLQELAIRFDDRISSRIAGACEVFEVRSHDYRVENKGSNAYNA